MKTIDSAIVDYQKEKELLLLKNNELKHLIKHLQEQLESLKRQLLERKSERYVKDDGQLYFPCFEDMAPVLPPEEEKKPSASHERRKAPYVIQSAKILRPLYDLLEKKSKRLAIFS